MARTNQSVSHSTSRPGCVFFPTAVGAEVLPGQTFMVPLMYNGVVKTEILYLSFLSFIGLKENFFFCVCVCVFVNASLVHVWSHTDSTNILPH